MQRVCWDHVGVQRPRKATALVGHWRHECGIDAKDLAYHEGKLIRRESLNDTRGDHAGLKSNPLLDAGVSKVGDIRREGCYRHRVEEDIRVSLDGPAGQQVREDITVLRVEVDANGDAS